MPFFPLSPKSSQWLAEIVTMISRTHHNNSRHLSQWIREIIVMSFLTDGKSQRKPSPTRFVSPKTAPFSRYNASWHDSFQTNKLHVLSCISYLIIKSYCNEFVFPLPESIYPLDILSFHQPSTPVGAQKINPPSPSSYTEAGEGGLIDRLSK